MVRTLASAAQEYYTLETRLWNSLIPEQQAKRIKAYDSLDPSFRFGHLRPANALTLPTEYEIESAYKQTTTLWEKAIKAANVLLSIKTFAKWVDTNVNRGVY